MTGPFTSCALEQRDEIRAMTAERKTSELSTNAANQAAHRLAISNDMRAIAFDRFARQRLHTTRAARTGTQGRERGSGLEDQASKNYSHRVDDSVAAGCDMFRKLAVSPRNASYRYR
jgi:hypothetical protein